MKKIILGILFICINLISFAQQDNYHIKFKGISLNTTSSEFSKKLISKGYTKDTSIADQKKDIFSGTFAGYNNCSIITYYTTNSNLVYGIQVLFPTVSNWEDLLNTYNSLKQNLTKKYGVPKESVEEFKVTVKNDNDKLKQVENGNCEYITDFLLDNGYIRLYIDHSDNLFKTECYITLLYCDKINFQIFEKENYDDL